MTTSTFGKRGLTRRAANPAPRFAVAAATQGAAAATFGFSGQAKRERSFADRLPILTLGLIAFLLCIFGIERRFAFDIDRSGQISLESMIALAAALVSCGFAARQYSSHSERAAQFIPSAEIPEGFKVTDGKATELLARYPSDPRSHIAQAVVYMRTRELASAEAELRKALALASTDFAGQPVVGLTQTLLAVVLAEEGRRGEAKAMVGGLCRDGGEGVDKLRGMLGRAKLCE